jgi:protein N-terminal methyltransferase
MLLSDFCARITLIDPVPKFLAKATADLASSGATVRTIQTAAEDWEVDEDYDLVWFQWSVGFLTDDDFVLLLRQVGDRLRPNGMIVIKDNIVVSDKRADAVWKPEQHAIARTLPHARELIARAGLKIDHEAAQPGYPEDLVPLYVFVLKN